MVRYRRLIIVLLAVAVVIPVIDKIRRRQYPMAPAVFSVESSIRDYVRISGDVRYPGMYPRTVNMLTSDAIEMAVPVRKVKMLEPAGIGSVPLSNGDSLQVLFRSGGSALVTRSLIPVAERLVMAIPLDINSIREAELDRVPGIGPELARRIVQYRQNNGGRMSVQDLLLVEGVGEKKFYSLRKLF